MKITLKDGSVKEYAEKMSVLQIAADISEGLARAACAGKVNGKVVDLRDEVSEDCELEILTFDNTEIHFKDNVLLKNTACNCFDDLSCPLYCNSTVWEKTYQKTTP